MKKGILTILALLTLSFQQEKKYKLELTATQLQIMWNAIDNSNAPHNQVKEIEALLQSQLKGQVDTAKIKK